MVHGQIGNAVDRCDLTNAVSLDILLAAHVHHGGAGGASAAGQISGGQLIAHQFLEFLSIENALSVQLILSGIVAVVVVEGSAFVDPLVQLAVRAILAGNGVPVAGLFDATFDQHGVIRFHRDLLGRTGLVIVHVEDVAGTGGSGGSTVLLRHVDDLTAGCSGSVSGYNNHGHFDHLAAALAAAEQMVVNHVGTGVVNRGRPLGPDFTGQRRALGQGALQQHVQSIIIGIASLAANTGKGGHGIVRAVGKGTLTIENGVIVFVVGIPISRQLVDAFLLGMRVGRQLIGKEAAGIYGIAGRINKLVIRIFGEGETVLIDILFHLDQQVDLVTVHINAAGVGLLSIVAVAVGGNALQFTQNKHGRAQIQTALGLLITDVLVVLGDIEGVVVSEVGSAQSLKLTNLVVGAVKLDIVNTLHGDDLLAIRVGIVLGDHTCNSANLGQHIGSIVAGTNHGVGNIVALSNALVLTNTVVIFSVGDGSEHAVELDGLIAIVIYDIDLGRIDGNGRHIAHDHTIGNQVVAGLGHGAGGVVRSGDRVLGDQAGDLVLAVHLQHIVGQPIVLIKEFLILSGGVDGLPHSNNLSLVHIAIDHTGLVLVAPSLPVVDGHVVADLVQTGGQVKLDRSAQGLHAVGVGHHGGQDGILVVGGVLICGDKALGDLQFVDLVGQSILTHNLNQTLSAVVGLDGGSNIVEDQVAISGIGNFPATGAGGAVAHTLVNQHGQLIAGQRLMGAGLGSQVTVQLHLLSLGHDGGRPLALAGIHLQGVDDHGQRLGGGNGLFRLESAVAVTGNDAHLHAGVNVAFGPAALIVGRVGELVITLEVVRVERVATQHLDDDSGHLSAGEHTFGIETVALLTGKETHAGGDGDRFLVHDSVLVDKFDHTTAGYSGIIPAGASTGGDFAVSLVQAGGDTDLVKIGRSIALGIQANDTAVHTGSLDRSPAHLGALGIVQHRGNLLGIRIRNDSDGIPLAHGRHDLLAGRGTVLVQERIISTVTGDLLVGRHLLPEAGANILAVHPHLEVAGGAIRAGQLNAVHGDGAIVVGGDVLHFHVKHIASAKLSFELNHRLAIGSDGSLVQHFVAIVRYHGIGTVGVCPKRVLCVLSSAGNRQRRVHSVALHVVIELVSCRGRQDGHHRDDHHNGTHHGKQSAKGVLSLHVGIPPRVVPSGPRLAGPGRRFCRSWCLNGHSTPMTAIIHYDCNRNAVEKQPLYIVFFVLPATTHTAKKPRCKAPRFNNFMLVDQRVPLPAIPPAQAGAAAPPPGQQTVQMPASLPVERTAVPSAHRHPCT